MPLPLPDHLWDIIISKLPRQKKGSNEFGESFRLEIGKKEKKERKRKTQNMIDDFSTVRVSRGVVGRNVGVDASHCHQSQMSPTNAD